MRKGNNRKKYILPWNPSYGFLIIERTLEIVSYDVVGNRRRIRKVNSNEEDVEKLCDRSLRTMLE